MKKKAELKPCAYCGEKNRIYVAKMMCSKVRRYMIICERCGHNSLSVPFEGLARLMWNADKARTKERKRIV